MPKYSFILNFFKLYKILWLLAFPFLKKNRRLRAGFTKRRYAEHLAKADIWIQASSAGEAFLAVKTVEKLRPERLTKVLITSTTSQGIDILNSRLIKQNLYRLIDLEIDWFPFDCPETMKQAVKNINPSVMVLIETEIWPALFYYLKKNHTKILIINARLSRKSFNNYMKTKILWKHLSPDRILAVSDQDAERYRHLFNESIVSTMSNIKFECMEESVMDNRVIKKIRSFLPEQIPITILASVRKEEEKRVLLMVKYILQHYPYQIIAIFPRHMHRITEWKKTLKANHLQFYLRSKISKPVTHPGIILWDIFGELKQAYSLASIVFVGGSLRPLGGQNFLEPAAQGAVTVTGPYYDDFAWAGREIFDKGIVIKKKTWLSISRTIIQSLEIPVNRKKNLLLTKQYILSNQGGISQSCNEILNTLENLTTHHD